MVLMNNFHICHAILKMLFFKLLKNVLYTLKYGLRFKNIDLK